MIMQYSSPKHPLAKYPLSKYLPSVGLFTFIFACISACADTPAPVSDTSGNLNRVTVQQHFQALQQRFHALQQGEKDVIHITQFGDSHSAADFFTGRLRERLQARYGNAGIGWIAPLQIRGQRHALVSYEQEGWQLSDSRQEDGDFAMGGYTAIAENPLASVQLKARKMPLSGKWLLTLLAQAPKTLPDNSDNRPATLNLFDGDVNLQTIELVASQGWQVYQSQGRFPITVESNTAGVKIAGFWLEKANANGVIVEAVAANGAQNTLWNHWQSRELQRDLLKLSRSDLLIIAYGTNEAFNKHLTAAEFSRDFSRRIRWLKANLPHSVIIVIGAPEAYLPSALLPADDEEAIMPLSSSQGQHKINSFSEANYPVTVKASKQMQTRPLAAKTQPSGCEILRPPLLSQIQQAQARIAKAQGVLFWDWQAAMGGACQVQSLIDKGLMQEDGVHLTIEGYQHSADAFINYLQAEKLLAL
ncbi:MAG: hypothetical protein CSA44_01330 [Gammaproteobacteria bacterium]|nr:MAG: hypothetical protein CSA44_01330 [Gammaproteobacteria bacterium]